MAYRRIRVSGGFCLGMAAVLLTAPFPWLLAAALAAAIHELGHMAAIYLLGGRVRLGDIRLSSANLYISALDPGRELAAVLAGPLFSFLAVLLWPIAPRLALCAGAQLCYNLLPIYPLDGGRILCCLLPYRLCRWVAILVRLCLGLAALWLTFFLRMGIFPALLALLLLIRTK